MATNVFDMTDTWNNAGTLFHAVKMNVNYLAAANGSRLFELETNGVPQFAVDPSLGVIVGGATGGPQGANTVNAGNYYINGVLLQTSLSGTFQPADPDLTALAALSGVNVIYYRSGVSTWSPVTIGANLSFVGGTLSGTGGGGGVTDAEYVTAAAHAGLSNERVLTNTATVTWDFSTSGQAKANVTAVGNVLSSGTPTSGQYAKWVNATTIQGVAPSVVLTDLGAAPIASPIFTGDPQAPTPAAGDNDTSVATTAFVKNQGYATTASVSAGFQPLDGDLTAIAALTGTDTIYYRSGTNVWSPVNFSGLTFTGGVLTVTVGGGNVSNSGTPTAGQLAVWTDPTHIQGQSTAALGLAPIASPTFTGDPKAPTPTAGDNDTSIATTAFVTAAIAASPAGSARPTITADRTYFVRKDGSDANNGLADNAGGAFLTIQKAVNSVAAIDRSIFTVTIQIRDGTYNEPVLLKPGLGTQPINITGNVSSPGLVNIGGAACPISVTANQLGDTVYNLSNFKVSGTMGGIQCKGSTTLNADKIEFAASGNAQAFASASGATFNITNPTFSGPGTVTMLNCENFGSIQCNNTTVTFTNPISYNYVCFSAVLSTISVAQVTWVGGGNVTGVRYFVQTNAIIYTGGGGPAYIPGTVDGTAVPFGAYV